MKESNEQRKASGGEHVEAALDSVRDFLYHDSRRVASFISQFDDFGLLQQIKRTEAVEEVALDKANMSNALGLPGVARLQSGIDKQTVETSRDLSERTYDPLWTNAIAFLDYLEERELIVCDITQAHIGQIVLLSGQLTVLDLSLLKSAWDIPAVKQIIGIGMETHSIVPSSGNRHQRRAAEKSNAAPPQIPRSPTELALELVKIMPHPVLGRLDFAGFSVWCSFREEALVVAASDPMLKHGIAISGEWNALGILDAQPEPSSPDEADPMARFTPIVPTDPMLNPIGEIYSLSRP